MTYHIECEEEGKNVLLKLKSNILNVPVLLEEKIKVKWKKRFEQT